MTKFHCTVIPSDYIEVHPDDGEIRIVMQLQRPTKDNDIFLTREDAKRLRKELKKVLDA